MSFVLAHRIYLRYVATAFLCKVAFDNCIDLAGCFLVEAWEMGMIWIWAEEYSRALWIIEIWSLAPEQRELAA